MHHAVPRQTALALCLAVLSPWAQAQSAEVEPNNSCQIAQAIGTAPGASVTGEIVLGDVDYYRLTAPPGKLLQADILAARAGGGTLVDSVVGIYDSQCRQITFNDYAGDSVDSRALFKVPADGVLLVAAGGFPDFFFQGEPYEVGTYTLKVGKPTPPYLTGRVTQADSNTPLPLNSGPVTLMRCSGAGYKVCAEEVTTLPVAEDGSFALSLVAMQPGIYQMHTSPNGFSDTYSEPFTYEGPETVANVKLKVKPLPVTLSALNACRRGTPGGDCSFSVTVTNTTAEAIDAEVWTNLDTTPTGAPYGSASFSSGNALHVPVKVQLPAGATTVVTQTLPIAGAPTGMTGQAQVYVAKAGKPLATLGHSGFAFTVTALGTSNTNLGVSTATRQARVRRLLADQAALRAGQHAQPVNGTALSAAASVSITGTVLDANTGLPVNASYPPYVNLYACAQPGFSLCTGYMGGTQAAADGSFKIDTRRLAAGRYQLWGSGIYGYKIGYSAVIDYDGKTPPVVTFTMPPDRIVITNIKPCENFWAVPAGSKCRVSYDLSNLGSTPMTLASWISGMVQPTGSPVNTSAFSRTADGSAQGLVTLQAGETVHVDQPLPLVGKLAAGASYFPSIWLSTPDKPFDIQGFDLIPTVTTVPAPSTVQKH